MTPRDIVLTVAYSNIAAGILRTAVRVAGMPGNKENHENITPGDFPAPFSGPSADSPVAALYHYAVKRCKETIEWYAKHKKPKQLAAKSFRYFSIGLTTIGGIMPLLVTSRCLPRFDPANPSSIDYTQIGYVALALAAACVGLDKFFGFSEGWMRYITCNLKLQRMLEEFQIEIAILAAPAGSSGPGPAERDAILRRTQAFLQAVMMEVEAETAAWVAEYRSKIAELEKGAREQLEANKPGVVNLTIENATKYPGGVAVFLDGTARQTTRTDHCQIRGIFPGDHSVLVRAAHNGNTVEQESLIRLVPGQALPVTLSLPQP